MSPRHLLLFAAVTLALLAATGSARAGWYVGAAFVTTDSEFETAVDNFEADDSSYKLFAGRTLFKFLAIEAAYSDLGTHEDTVGLNTLDVEIETYGVAARGVLPVGDWLNLFVKAGYNNISVDGELDAAGLITDFDEDDWELIYGAGVEINFGKHFAVRAEWEEYDVESDLNSLSAGAVIRF